MAKLSSKQRRLVSEAVRSLAANLGLSTQRQIQQNQDGKGENEQRTADAPKNEERSAFCAWVAGLTWVAILIGWWSHSLGGVFNYFGGSPNILYPFAILSCIVGIVGANALLLYFKWPWVFNLLALVACLPLLLLTHRYVTNETRRLKSEANERRVEHSIITNEPSRFDSVDLGVANVSRKIDALDERNRSRHLTDDQFANLVEMLKGIPKDVIELKAVDADVEASKFRDELSNAFTQAGFKNSIARVMGASVDAYPKGVTLVDKTFPSPNRAAVEGIKKALTDAGVFVTSLDTHSGAVGQRLFVLVGPKPDSETLKLSGSIVVVANPKRIDPLPFRRKREGVHILLGKSSLSLPPVPPGAHAFKDIGRAFLLAGTHEHLSQIRLTADENQVVLNIRFAPIFGMPPLEITNNELTGLPADWDCNNSTNGIEIVNEKLLPIFQLYYKDDTHLALNGAITFINDDAKGVILAGGEGFQIMTRIENFDLSQQLESLHLKRLFRYPSWKHRGEFADDSN